MSWIVPRSAGGFPSASTPACPRLCSQRTAPSVGRMMRYSLSKLHALAGEVLCSGSAMVAVVGMDQRPTCIRPGALIMPHRCRGCASSSGEPFQTPRWRYRAHSCPGRRFSALRADDSSLSRSLSRRFVCAVVMSGATPNRPIDFAVVVFDRVFPVIDPLLRAVFCGQCLDVAYHQMPRREAFFSSRNRYRHILRETDRNRSGQAR